MSVMEKTPGEARLEILAACERLCLDYAHLADAGRMDEWADLFAEDAEMVLFGQRHVGRAAIKAAVAGGGGGGSLHVTSNIRIDVTGDGEAAGTAYVAAYVKPPGGAASLAPAAVGVYRDRYRRTPQGWRFAFRAFEPFAVAGG
jgi:hypothetical protein